MPSRFPIEVAATASVGLTTAPRAMPAARLRSGRIVERMRPISTDETTTRTTDRPEIAFRLRRKSTSGTLTAAEYSSGGSTPARIHSGLTSTSGTNGR